MVPWASAVGGYLYGPRGMWQCRSSVSLAVTAVKALPPFKAWPGCAGASVLLALVRGSAAHMYMQLRLSLGSQDGRRSLWQLQSAFVCAVYVTEFGCIAVCVRWLQWPQAAAARVQL
jgi:hypothetical protein